MSDKHVLIKYDHNINKYSLTGLEDTTGTFLKVMNPIEVRDNYVFSFGEHHICALIHYDSITLRTLNNQPDEYRFDAIQGPIKIGRSQECDIKFDDNSLSRI